MARSSTRDTCEVSEAGLGGGDGRLTGRERQILEAVVGRATNAEIANRLGISERTVESHVSAVLRKYGARDRTELVLRPPDRDPLPHQLDAMRRRAKCVGRNDELAQLTACWRASRSGLRVAVVLGPAGIGKSLVVAVVAASAHVAGAGVRFGACTATSDRAYEPFIQALGGDVPAFVGREDARLQGVEEGLARLFPVIERGGPASPLDPAQAHAAVVQALHACLDAASADRPLVVVLEDVHWASSGTRNALAALARIGGAIPVLLVVTARDDPSLEPEASLFIAELARLPVVDVLALRGLDVDAAGDLINEVGGHLDPAEAVRATGGNPLFLREIARVGAASTSLRSAVAARAAHLTADELAVLDLAAAVGTDLDAVLIARTLGRQLDDVLDNLERLEAAGLIGAGGGAVPGQFAFVHDVFRSVRYESLGVGERMRLHAALARTLAGSDSPPLADLARHACLAGPRFDPAAAADLARRAGDVAAAATDAGAAIEHYQRALGALELAAKAESPQDRIELTIRLGAAQVLAGDPDGFTNLLRVAEEARRRGHGVAVAAAFCALSPMPGAPISMGGDDDYVADLGAAALELLAPHEAAWRIRVLAALGMQLRMTGAEERGETMVGDAVRAARRLGDPVALGRALLSWRSCGGPLEVHRRLACGRELIELGDHLDEEVLSYKGRLQLAWCYRELGQVDEMARWQAEAARRTKIPDIELAADVACGALLKGDLARAQALTERLEDLTHFARVTSGFAVPLRHAIADLRDEPRDLRKVEVTMRRPKGVYRGWMGVMDAVLGRLLARAGQHRRAGELLADAAGRGFEPRYASYGSTTIGSCWAEVAMLCSDIAAGGAIARWFEPLAHRFVDNGVAVSDTVDRVRTLALLAAGDTAAALAVGADAVRRSRIRGTPILLGRELVVLAAARQRSGLSIEDEVDEATVIAERTGARVIVNDVRLFVGRPPTDPSGLTAREREVMEQVQRGATNDQIARTLGISAATVRTHLVNVFAKLDVSTRTAAAARFTGGEARPAGWGRPRSPADG